MQIVFGLHLDGLAYPATVDGKIGSFNSLVCGSAGLLNVLETALGLSGQTTPNTIRIAQYLSALKSLNTTQLFYSRSFANDQWSTAKLVLSIRDQLISGGWKGQPLEASPKTQTLSELENAVVVDPGIADRHWTVNSILAAITRSPIDRLSLLNSRTSLPFAWQQTLNLLEKAGTQIEERLPNPAATAERDLGQLQRRFQNGNAKIQFKGDGSVAVIDADDEIQAAEATAAFLYATSDGDDLVIIRGNDSSALNFACSRFGIPECGTPASSPHRALLQVLPLAFEIIWRPLNPTRLLEFLSIRGGPISSYDAASVINAIKEQPGIDGPLWQEAWEQARLRRSDTLQKRDPQLTPEEALAKASDQIADWKSWFYSDVDTAHNALSAKQADEVCRRVQRWAVSRASMETSHNLFSIANSQATTLAEIISRSSLSAITLNQLRNMLDASMKEGASNDVAQSSPWSIVNHPGQVWGKAGEVLWWGFADTQKATVLSQLWTKHEIFAFANEAVHLESPTTIMQRESLAWRLPVMNATRALILVKPRVIAGEQARSHCLWDEMKGLITADSLQSVEIAGKQIAEKAQTQIADRIIKSFPVQPKPLPPRQREWLVSEILIKPRTKESFTSLEKMLGCPFAWTLEYRAKLKASSTQDLPREERLIGTLAHAVIRRIWEESKDWQPNAGATRATELLEEMIPHMAASLLLPGAGPMLRRCKEAVPLAVSHLISILRKAELTVLGCELPYESKFNSTAFGGNIDMVVQNKVGAPIILDLKWTRSPKYLREKLADGKALQLAAYSWLLTPKFASSDSQPPGGFFLLRQSQLFFSEPEPFADAHISSGRSLAKTWSLATEHYELAMNQLRDGTLTASGVDVQEDENRLVDPPCRFCSFEHLCGLKELV